MNNIPSSAILMFIAVVAAGLLAIFLYDVTTTQQTALLRADTAISKNESRLSESQLTKYDGEEISGTELVNLLKTFSNKELSIFVDNKVSQHTYFFDYDFTTGEFIPVNDTVNMLQNVQDRTSSWYIDPSQTYHCTARRSAATNAVVQLYFQAEDSSTGTFYDVEAAPQPTEPDGQQETYYYIYYVANGGSGNVSEQKTKTGTTASIRENMFSKNGFVFQGWAETPDGTVKYHPGDSYLNPGGTTLYAVWKKTKIDNYTITFDSMGGDQVSPMTVEEGTPVSTLPPSSRAGYSFNGWYLNRNLSGSRVVSFTSLGQNITLYAGWIEKRHIVKFYGNGGDVDFGNGRTGSTMSIEVNEGIIPVIPGANNPGYQLDGWYDNAGNRLTSSTVIRNDAEYTARYRKSVMTIRLESNDGTNRRTEMALEYGETGHLPECMYTFTGMKFIGWGESRNYDGRTKNAGDEIINTSAQDSIKTFYALWDTES